MAIALVQQAQGSVTTGTSNAVTISATSAGNCLVVAAALNGAAGGVTSIASGGDTWAKLDSTGVANYYDELWYCKNISASVTTVTLTSASSGRCAAIVIELSGVDTTAPADVHGASQNAGSTSATLAGTITESASGIYIYSLAHTNSSAPSGVSGGFTQLTTAVQSAGTGPSCDAGYLIQTSPSATNPIVTLGASSDWDMKMGVLLAASGVATNASAGLASITVAAEF